MPLVGHPRQCERCREERPVRSLVAVRVRLLTGPNGERLCQKHHHEAWTEYMNTTNGSE